MAPSTIHPYVADTMLATRGLFALIGDDHAVLTDKRTRLEAAVKVRSQAQAILHTGPPPTGFGEDTRPYFEKRARVARTTIEETEAEVSGLEATILAKEASVQALAGAVLQIAKQGVAVVHGSLAACPAGRAVGRETLKNVIWQARNQSMHWEENSFSSHVMTCFGNLALDFGTEFVLPGPTPKSLARQILQVLGWTTYVSFETDLASLL